MQGLSVVDGACLDGGFDGQIDIGRGQNDEGVGAAELEDGTLDQPAGLGGDCPSGGLGTGDGDCGDALIGEDGFDLAGFEQQRLEGAAWEACAADEGFDGDGALWNV